MIVIAIVILSIIMDGLLTNFLSFMVNDLSFFTPFFSLISLISIFKFYSKDLNKYYLLAFVTGFIYDLLYTNLLFLNGFLFLLVAIIIKHTYYLIEINYLKQLILSICIITIYESIFAILIFIFQLVPITIFDIIYKITHTLIINIIYVELLELIVVNFLPKKYKRHRIN